MTRKTLDKLPEKVRIRIERFHKDAKTDIRHRELYICKGSGYLAGLQDAGIITEQERKILFCYLTV